MPKKKSDGTGGRGTMPFKTKITVKNKKLTYGGEREIMPDGYKGRVVYGGTSRTGRKEGTGPAS